MIKGRIIYAVLIAVVLLLATSNWILFDRLNKIVVVDAIKVFNAFNMKMQMERSVDLELKSFSDHLDSMNVLLQMAQQNNDLQRIEKINVEIAYTRQEAQRTYQISNKNINEQVWKRLNPLIDEFGKKNGYRIVIGANGMGAVLYNVDEVEKTDDLIKFVNNRYETGN